MHSYSCTHVYICLDSSNVYIFVGLNCCTSATGYIGDSIRGSFYSYASWGVPPVVVDLYIFWCVYILETLYILETYIHMCILVPWWHVHFTIYLTI